MRVPHFHVAAAIMVSQVGRDGLRSAEETSALGCSFNEAPKCSSVIGFAVAALVLQTSFPKKIGSLIWPLQIRAIRLYQKVRLRRASIPKSRRRKHIAFRFQMCPTMRRIKVHNPTVLAGCQRTCDVTVRLRAYREQSSQCGWLSTGLISAAWRAKHEIQPS